MITPRTYEELAAAIDTSERVVLFFTADWCPDCQFIYPALPEIEAEHSEWTFIRVNRDDFMPLAQKWDIFGIPSFLVLNNGQEIGRFVSKERKSKSEINSFLAGFKRGE